MHSIIHTRDINVSRDFLMQYVPELDLNRGL